MPARFVRVAEQDRQPIEIKIDGVRHTALEGDTLLVAVLTHAERLRQSEFGDGSRAGFCLMGACQDCWMWTADGQRIRACTTTVAPGMSVLTNPPSEDIWPISA
ncbi:(2Fe-2S)-binding protein [Microvirga arabica]|uniref:(2Fe-2S)-binding protein n=1 Tax=Microvirga arabica TaxID=1128671 RepID=A0ABV6Y751_9HYPH